jgi:glycosyltransferase involved in cell wall biosynthesis
LKKLKILIVSDYAFVKGGAEQVAIASAAGLAEKNHEVVFFSAVGPVSEALDNSGLKEIICLGQSDILDSKNKIKAMVSGIYNLRAVKELKRLLKRWRPDIIHMHGLSKALSWAVVLPANLFKIPVIYTIHDYGLFCPNLGIYNFNTQEICQYYKEGHFIQCLKTNCDKRSYGQKLWRWLRFKITRRIIRFDKKVSAFIAVGKFLKQFVDKNLKTGKPVRLIYNPLVIDDKGLQAEGVNRKNTMQDKLLRFLYAGRLSQEKGVELLLDAIREVEAELIIIGDGELMGLCRQVSEETGGRVKILGYRKRDFVFSTMRSSDMLVLPSKWLDPAPLILAEAAYNGLPCLVADHGGLPEFVKQGINGIYFEPGNLSSLKGTMNEIVEDPDLLISLKERAGEIIGKMNLDIGSHTDEILKLYHEILGRN